MRLHKFILPWLGTIAGYLLAHNLLSKRAKSHNPTFKLPFELPRSMQAVRAQKPDLSYDSLDPVYAFGHGLSY